MTKKRKITWTIITVIAIALAISGAADQTAETYAEDAFKRALVTFAAARTLNGVISVVQSTEVGVGVTVGVGEILDPVNDLIERFSGVMLIASSSLGLQNVLLNVTATQGVTIALVIAAVFGIATLWWPRLTENRMAIVGSKILFVAFCIRFLVPVLVIATNLISDVFLTASQEEATAALEVTTRDIEDLKEPVEATPPPDQSLMDRLNSAIDDSIAAVNVSDRLSNLKESAANATEHIVDLIVLFVLQTIILPLAFLWLIVQLLKRTAEQIRLS